MGGRTNSREREECRREAGQREELVEAGNGEARCRVCSAGFLTLVQYFLSMIQFIPFGMVMHILGTVCWKYGIHILILQGAALKTLSGVSEETLDFKQSGD